MATPSSDYLAGAGYITESLPLLVTDPISTNLNTPDAAEQGTVYSLPASTAPSTFTPVSTPQSQLGVNSTSVPQYTHRASSKPSILATVATLTSVFGSSDSTDSSPELPSLQQISDIRTINKVDIRPTGLTSQDVYGGLPRGKVVTEYVKMLLASREIPSAYGHLANHLFHVALLYGYVLLPGTFNSIPAVRQNLGSIAPTNVVDFRVDLKHLVELPLFLVAWGCLLTGAGGLIYLWLKWRRNYIWLMINIFRPGLVSASAGLISTIGNIYGAQGAQKGKYSTSSKLTLYTTGGSMVLFGILCLFYRYYLIKRTKKRHVLEVGKTALGKYGEGVQVMVTKP